MKGFCRYCHKKYNIKTQSSLYHSQLTPHFSVWSRESIALASSFSLSYWAYYYRQGFLCSCSCSYFSVFGNNIIYDNIMDEGDFFSASYLLYSAKRPRARANRECSVFSTTTERHVYDSVPPAAPLYISYLIIILLP